MDNERIREICLALPHVTESVNWGHHLVYWTCDKAIGGKMFAMTDLDGSGTGVLWFHCGPERFHELIEHEDIIAAPYLARAHWVAVLRWDALRSRQYEDELRLAHELMSAKLPPGARKILAMPERERSKVIREKKKKLEERENATAKKIRAGK